MAQAIFGVISAIAGICKIVQFGQQQQAKQNEDASALKVQVGLNYKGGLSNADGDLPDVRVWDEAGNYLGMSADPGDVGSGEQGEITVDQSGGAQATYVLFSANDNAVCIATAAITWPDDHRYGWLGDWGKECDGSWFHSNIYVNNKNYKPACLWIDANDDQPQTGFSMHWPEFVSKSGKIPADKDTSYFCDNTPVFQLHTEDDPNSIDTWTLNDTSISSSRVVKRSQRAPKTQRSTSKSARFGKRNPGHHHRNKLVISKDPINHGAKDLCDSKTSRGPDFANINEGLFCDMSEKKLYKICDRTMRDNCFNMETRKLVINGVTARSSKYQRTFDWSLEQDD